MKHKIKALEELIKFASEMEKTRYTNRKRKKNEPKQEEEAEADEE